ncbi:hypothetical protein JAAARDRAFT_133813 [Jaapia argillacea MUCL 33604]|uniref:DNA replication ATP-dependent helicase/nuclease DNA2 n=1 Tax=Jaapia argillacea MUCL 33604 TaxID=933084 RepID=A0A067PKZ7_9AGAM|nr:hypothetical protein JAAARDRAFT_133813 [Jaapia argillacea MUCL 33604]
MPPTTHTKQEEDAFMTDLFAGLNDSFFDSCPEPSPVRPSHSASTTRAAKPTTQATPSKPKIAKPMLRVAKTPSKALSKKANAPCKEEDVDMAFLADGLASWDDMEGDLMTPKKEKKAVTRMLPSTSSDSVRETCTRCIVDQIEEKALTVIAVETKDRRTVILEDDWYRTDIRLGDVINTIGPFSPASTSSLLTIHITNNSNLLIHHPDILLTATAISNAPKCRRKPLLTNLVRSIFSSTPTIDDKGVERKGDGSSPALVWGNMLHEVMQSCLKEGKWEDDWIDKCIMEKVGSVNGLGELVRIGVGVEEAVREVKERAKGLKGFGERYVGDVPKEVGVLVNTRSKGVENSMLAIRKLEDVEEDILSPSYGLRGKLDASVQAVIQDRNVVSTTKKSGPANKNSNVKLGASSNRTPTLAPPTTQTHTLAPFEIKTGRSIAGLEHRAQTMLYTLLMEERYGEKVESGLLYYTQSEEVVRVPRARNEVRALIGVRNEMAGFLGRGRGKGKGQLGEDKGKGKEEMGEEEKRFLPETIDDEWVCGKCYVVDTCMLYRKAVENVFDDSSPIANIYALKTGHLTPSQGEFFKKWEELISIEEQDAVRFKKELWTMGAKEREDRGRCFGDMVLDEGFVEREEEKETRRESKIHQFTYRFVRRRGGEEGSLLNGHMSCGDAINVSVEPDLLALARGFIVELTPTEVVVGVDHEIRLEMIRKRVGLWDEGDDIFGGGRGKGGGELVFRIDKDEMFAGMGRIRDNLAHLFYAQGDTRRLHLVVDLAPPRFFDIDPSPSPSSDCETSAAIAKFSKGLNGDQLGAMNKVLAAQDYACILGMPGTGKTTVIAAIIKVLVELGKSVLLTSYTHSAVDTILGKLAGKEEDGDVGFGILRLGNVDKVHPDVRRFTLEARKPATTIQQLEHQIMTPPIVATTCLSIDHTSARKGGLDVSLFRRLSEAHPEAVVDLTHQYRMNADIMLLSNKLIYGDRLRCGSEEVRRRALVLPERRVVEDSHAQTACGKDDCWLNQLMSESCKAVFVDTDLVPARDSRIGDLVQNEIEANLVYQVTEALLKGGVSQDQIGIISLYRQQIKLIGNLLKERKEVEILTADKSQGRDKDCVVISMVRSNDDGQIGDLVRDWRRMNVSFTRAKSKLIIFGSRSTLQATPLLSQFFQLMDGQGWILRLPANAHEMHAPVLRKTSMKRSVEELDKVVVLKENVVGSGRPMKKMKKGKAEEGLLKGRPILKDLVNDGR